MSSRHMKGLDHTSLNLASNVVTINLYVLYTLMKYWICSNIESYLAITVQRSWVIMIQIKSSK